ncbi:MAG TPA: glycosyltransferase, partial [Candidatus Hydrogenedentes bacterium]|nr:glycosyltransferase [Candidatus Hydrogenedentota bacterium]
PLKNVANVHLLGNRPIEALPAYLKGMDVTLIPYKTNEATRYIYPLKLQEYLAAGKPVVSAALPAVVQYRDVVYIAESHPAFLDRIEDALAERDPARIGARQAVARANSWERRIEEKSVHVLRVLERTARPLAATKV